MVVPGGVRAGAVSVLLVSAENREMGRKAGEPMTPNWKPTRGTAKAERRARKKAADKKEREQKADVRKRDKRCRFPLCGCRRVRHTPEVSHGRHKGIGGNPKGDRSDARLMVLLCPWRHRGSAWAVDAGTLEWEALDPELGANGPIRWLADVGEGPNPGTPDFLVIATEKAPGVLEPLLPWQRECLKDFSDRIK